MMGSMSHDGEMMNESGVPSCDQHKKSVMVHAQANNASPSQSGITGTEEMTCSICICAVCSTIISSDIVSSHSFVSAMDWRFPEPAGFISSSHSNLYKPPRP